MPKEKFEFDTIGFLLNAKSEELMASPHGRVNISSLVTIFQRLNAPETRDSDELKTTIESNNLQYIVGLIPSKRYNSLSQSERLHDYITYMRNTSRNEEISQLEMSMHLKIFSVLLALLGTSKLQELTLNVAELPTAVPAK
ncbi:hypothetical protein [Aureimonas glaciei]|nr:hypothetical protein [Aureimonas glaciei]